MYTIAYVSIFTKLHLSFVNHYMKLMNVPDRVDWCVLYNLYERT